MFWISCSYADQLQKQSDSYGYLIERATKRQEYVLHQEEIAFRETQAKVLRLLEEMRQDRFGKDAKIPLCIGELVLHLNREAYAQEHPIRERAMQGLYEMMMDYIEEHLKENLDLNELSHIFHVSKYHISHVFKDETGISVHQYILKKRLDACKAPSAAAIRSRASTRCLDFGIIPLLPGISEGIWDFPERISGDVGEAGSDVRK